MAFLPGKVEDDVLLHLLAVLRPRVVRLHRSIQRGLRCRVMNPLQNVLPERNQKSRLLLIFRITAQSKESIRYRPGGLGDVFCFLQEC